MQNTQGTSGKMPASMKDITFKRLMNLIERLKQENNADLQVMLYTSMGVVICDIEPCAHSNEMIKYTDDPSMFTLDISAIYDELKQEFKSNGNNESMYSDAYLLNAKNVTICEPSLNNEFIYVDQLIIFTDQVIGFSLMPRKKDMFQKGNNFANKG